MLTTKEREQLHTILDLCVDIKNQDIADTNIFYVSECFSLLIKLGDDTIYHNSFIRPNDYGDVITWLEKVATGNIEAIPGYAERLEKLRAEKQAQYLALKAEFENTK
jgi:hypothetical protein